MRMRLLEILGLGLLSITLVRANPDAKRLYSNLLANYDRSQLTMQWFDNTHNLLITRLIRPVANNSDRLTVHMRLKLSQVIGVDMRRQILTTNVWVEQEWEDYKLTWNPEDYGGVKFLHVPSQDIWLPDIVLYNKSVLNKLYGINTLECNAL